MKGINSKAIAFTFLFFISFIVSFAAVAEEERDALFGSWSGVKDSLEDSGVNFEAVILADFLSLVSGGLDRGSDQIFTYNFGLEVDTEQAGLWSNGTFLVNLLGINGGPLYNRVGDFQVSSNIDGMGVDTFSVYEAWYEHSFLDGKVTFLTGFHDYNSEFYLLDYSSLLLNSSFGFGIDVSQIGNSTYPVTGLTGRLRVEPSENTYVLMAAYDGRPGDPENYNGTHLQLSEADGVFYAAEVGVTSTEEQSIRNYYKLALGGWYSTTEYNDFADRAQDQNGGVYLIGEKQVFSESDPTQGLGIFAQMGFAQASRNQVGQYYGAGFHYTGLFNGRDSDITTFGVWLMPEWVMTI